MSERVTLSDAHLIVLAHINQHPRQISRMSEPYRQRTIDLAMMEPALVDADGDWAIATIAGNMMIADAFARPTPSALKEG